MPVVTGAEFNFQFPFQLYKLVNFMACHRGYQYHLGLNLDPIPLTPHSWGAGGFHFTMEDDFYRWIDYDTLPMESIYEVEIPDEAQVYFEYYNDQESQGLSMMKTDRFILSNPRKIADLPEWQDSQLQLACVKDYPNLIRFFPDAHDHILELALTQNGLSVRFLTNPSEHLQLVAVKECGLALQYLDHPSYQVQTQAIINDGLAIRFVPEPDEELQLLAIRHGSHLIYLIKNPCPQVQFIVYPWQFPNTKHEHKNEHNHEDEWVSTD